MQTLRNLMRPRIVFPIVILIIGAVELALADRKYGIFSGGFGQSSAIDTLGETAIFLTGYAATQIFMALLVWKICAWFNRHRDGWPEMYHFTLAFGGLSAFAMTTQYQLHSYFSDAVDFALLQQLGGGSLKDALLFGKNEIAMGGAAICLFALAWWIVWRLLKRVWGVATREGQELPKWRWIALSCLVSLALVVLVPRFTDDAAKGLGRMVVWQAMLGLASTASDFDGDGYGLAGTRSDSHPFDASRHPLALDIPGNGIDEDGYGGDLTLVPVPQPRPETVLDGKSPHVVIVVMESTRADALTRQYDGKPVAPNLARVARAGTGITPSFSHVGFTTSSLKSIFAGALVPRPGDPSLFTELKKSGYRINIFSGQPEDFGDISETVAMRQNADIFIDAEKLKDQRAFSFAAQGSLLVDEEVLIGEFDRHLGKAADWEQPQFIYLNFQSPHFPYDHPGLRRTVTDNPLTRSEINSENAEMVAKTYWNAVAHSDFYLGELIARLKQRGVWDDTVLMVTGDHGEALFERGFLGHGHMINTTQNGTFLAINRTIDAIEAPIAISDYRAILLDLLTGKPQKPQSFRPFMHIGDLDKPSTIGMTDQRFGVVSLRLDTGEACFEQPMICRDHENLQGDRMQAVNRLIARWGSERWAARASGD